MMPERLNKGDCIGMVCPSHISEGDRYANTVKVLRRLGFRSKLGANIAKATHGYLASPEERAEDFNAMARDPDVKLVLFGGGWGAQDLLPLIDYDAVRRNTKFYSSYSDGTSILNAIHAKTGIIAHYGQGTGEFLDLRQYDYERFRDHFVSGHRASPLAGEGEWRTLSGGTVEGVLIGGYILNFALLLGTEYLRDAVGDDCVLFLEDHESYHPPVAINAFLSVIERHEWFGRVRGLLFGHYSDDAPKELTDRLARLGERHRIPVAYCDDFGHFGRHAILPIGARAAFDADAQSLRFIDE